MNKKLFFILLGAFVFLTLPKAVMGGWCVTCVRDGNCGYSQIYVGATTHASCFLKNYKHYTSCTYVSECGDSNKKCKSGACPNYSGWNGENCYLRTKCDNTCKEWPESCTDPNWSCTNCGLKWDATYKECVECNCTNHTKFKKWGDTSGIYCGCDPPGTTPTNSGACESACGAHSWCDERFPGWTCGSFSEIGLGCDGYKRKQYNGGNNCVIDSPAGSCNSTCGCDPPGQNKKYIPGQCKLCPFGTIDCSKSGNVTVSSDCDVYDSMHQPNGDITIKSGVIVTIKDNSTLTFSPGYSIFIEDGGYILISTNNGKIQQQ